MRLRTIKFPGLQETFTVNDLVEDSVHPGCFYRWVDGQMEWQNPPMGDNVEYRTTERYRGYPVYRFLLNFGSLPNNTFKEHSLGVGHVTIVDIHGVCKSTEQLYEFPVVDNSGSARVWYYTREGADGDFIQVWTNGDYSNSSAWFWVKYVKA